MGVTDSAIDYWMRKHGIKARTISEARAVKYWGSSGPKNGMYGRTGEDNANWRGGITPERQSLYGTREWKIVVSCVWKRDKASCRCCGRTAKSLACKMHIHHLESFMVVDKRADVSNLVLVCKECHNYIHSNANVDRLFLLGDNK